MIANAPSFNVHEDVSLAHDILFWEKIGGLILGSLVMLVGLISFFAALCRSRGGLLVALCLSFVLFIPLWLGGGVGVGAGVGVGDACMAPLETIEAKVPDDDVAISYYLLCRTGALCAEDNLVSTPGPLDVGGKRLLDRVGR